MGITTEATQEEGHLLMHHGVHGDSAFELSVLLCIRKLAIQQQVTGLDEISMIGQLVDRVAAIQQNAFLAIDIGDVGLAACCRGETRIVGEVTALAIERRDVDDARAKRSAIDRKFVGLAVHRKGRVRNRAGLGSEFCHVCLPVPVCLPGPP